MKQIANGTGSGAIFGAELPLYLLGTIILLGVAIWTIVKGPKAPFKMERSFPRYLRVAMGSFGMVFGGWILLSTLALPIVGTEGFEMMSTHLFNLLWLAGTVSIYPFVNRHMK